MPSKFDKNIAAFTLMEVIVGLTLTVILLLVCLNGLRLFQGLYQMIEDTQREVYELSEFKRQIISEFKKAEYATLKGSVLSLELPLGEYIYDFGDEIIVKNRIVNEDVFADTFQLAVKEAIFLFQNEEVFFDLVDELRISCKATESQTYLWVNKEYSANSLMNYFK